MLDLAGNCARVCICGLSGDSGKTIVSLSLLAVIRQKALSVSVFKKGPDYIDAAWLGQVAGKACRNLDTYLADPTSVQQTFTRTAAESDIALIEGNRGLFDGLDLAGTHSSAALAQLLQTPVILVVDCTKTTRTVAAMVRGCLDFDPELQIAGVILNRVAGKRHQQIVTEAIEKYNGLPVVGAIPKLDKQKRLIPDRHLGLVPPSEFADESTLLQELGSIGNEFLDIDRILAIARSAEPLPEIALKADPPTATSVRVGYFNDPVFTFYYPENLEALTTAGAELVPVNSLSDRELPRIDALYIGGGFPETFAEKLSANESLRQAVKAAGETGLPIYAECGGLIYLSRTLTWQNQTYPLAGLLPLDLELRERPVGHGYTECEVDRANPYFPEGSILRGHEFHYSAPLNPNAVECCLQMHKGVGVSGGRDGILYKSTFACYTHLHAAGVPGWAPALVQQAGKYRRRRSGGGGGGKALAHTAAMN
ncbi:MAG: cobyrinate a,c-diamide synthase [bacterium]